MFKSTASTLCKNYRYSSHRTFFLAAKVSGAVMECWLFIWNPTAKVFQKTVMIALSSNPVLEFRLENIKNLYAVVNAV